MKRFLAVVLALAVAVGTFVPMAFAAPLDSGVDSTATPPPVLKVTAYTSSSSTKTKVYASTKKGAKVLKTYAAGGKKLSLIEESASWYKASVKVNGKTKTGYFKKSQLDFPKTGDSIIATNVAPGLKVYSSISSNKVIKTYGRGATKTYTPYTNQWYRLGLTVKGKKVTGYVKVADIKRSSNTKAKWILIDQSEYKLYLYQGSKLIKKYPITVGMQGHSTPNGTFSIVEKRKNPTWVNPDPKGWGSNMPKKIGPGPSNPLGVRALNLSVSGIRIHGSANPKNGTRSSHGCIRLTNKNIKDLYNRVSVGTTVVIQK